MHGAWLSLVERVVRDYEVAGSNPVAPMRKGHQQKCWCLYFCNAKKRQRCCPFLLYNDIFIWDKYKILFQIFPKESFHLVKWDDVHLIIQICVHSVWDDHKFFVLPFQFLKRILAEIAGMCFFSVDQQYRIADLIAVA